MKSKFLFISILVLIFLIMIFSFLLFSEPNEKIDSDRLSCSFICREDIHINLDDACMSDCIDNLKNQPDISSKNLNNNSFK